MIGAPIIQGHMDGFALTVGGEVLAVLPDTVLAMRALNDARQVYRDIQALTCRDQDQAFKDMETDSIEHVLEGLSWVQKTQGDRL